MSMAIFNCYVSSPEGTNPWTISGVPNLPPPRNAAPSGPNLRLCAVQRHHVVLDALELLRFLGGFGGNDRVLSHNNV